MLIVPANVSNAADARVRAAIPDIQRTLSVVQTGRPFDAEPDPRRRRANLANLLSISEGAAADLLANGSKADQPLPASTLTMAEAIQGDSIDWQPVGWLRWALKASRPVVRILRGARGWGTGFLISDQLLLTNNHVIPDPLAARDMTIEFDYELDEDAAPRPTFRYRLQADALFITDERDDLDFTVVAVGAPIEHGEPLQQFGSCFLSDNDAKHALGNHVTVVQHPNGGQKLIVFRENRILHRGPTVLHYTADTEPGSSGSPVFNDRFQVVALHHWGSPHRELLSADGAPLRTDVNEGIRISAIVRDLRARREALNAGARTRLEAALREPASASVVVLTESHEDQPIATPVIAPPTETPMAEEAVQIDPDYSSRGGYDPRFLGTRFVVPLPKLSESQEEIAARVRGVGTTQQHVLKYHHFSIALNARDRLAFFTAVNIYGPSWKNVDRDTGLVLDEAAEARERWYIDERIPAQAQADDSIYLNQITSRRYFQRGHLVRRLDPTWGSKRIAEFANGDTFHFTNCAPQAQGFNDAKTKWAGIEDYVLYTARAVGDRISVFSGPIFSKKDPVWRGIRVPLRFYKIVARVEDGALVATALIADQSEQVKEVISGQAVARPEAYEDWANMPRAVREFHRSVKEVEDLTELDFGPLRDADRPGTSAEPLPPTAGDEQDGMEQVLSGTSGRRVGGGGPEKRKKTTGSKRR